MKKTFNEGFFDQTAPQVKKDEELAKKGDWDLGSGDTIPPEITLDEKALEKLKKENEKAVQNSIKSAEKATKEYAKTVHNITENPDTWTESSARTHQEVIIEKPSWWSKIFSWWNGS